MSDSDLNWLALRYVTGEMADAELAAFEETLADSQPAREAVAAAVLLAQAVVLAERTPASVTTAGLTVGRPSWRGRLAWALVGAAASLLLAGGLQLWREARQAPNPVGHHQSAGVDDLSNLAIQWTAAGDFEFDVADNGGSERRDFDDSAAEGRGAFTIADLFEDLAAPDWLLTAVSSETRSPMAAPMQNPDG
jgi:hypothetical protein